MFGHKKIIINFILVGVMLVYTPQYLIVNGGDNSISFIQQKGFIPSEFVITEEMALKPVTREEMAAVLICALGEKGNTADFSLLPFKDKEEVSQNVKGYFTKAFELGLITGEPLQDGSLMAYPHRILTRQEAAVMLGKTTGLQEFEETAYFDNTQIALWARGYISALNRANILQGDSQGNFQPLLPITWGSLSVMLQTAYTTHKLALPAISLVAKNHSNDINTYNGMNKPMGISRDEKGVIYYADQGNGVIGVIDTKGMISKYAGVLNSKDIYGMALGGYGDGDLEKAVFYAPTDTCLTAEGMLVADEKNNAIRLIKDKTVYTYAGGKESGTADGNRLRARFYRPTSLTADSQGNLYISDTLNHTIRKIDKNGIVTTIAGTPGKAGFADGAGDSALLCEPRGIVFQNGVLYIADSGNQRIRVLEKGVLTTLAGGGTKKYENTHFYEGDWVDGSAMTARFNNPQDLSFGTDGVLYIADAGNGMIRRYFEGRVDTLIGAGQPINTSAMPVDELICEPSGILALEGSIVVSDRFTNKILSISLEE